MYFSVLGGNDDYIDIKTNSFPKSFRIRLLWDIENYEKTIWCAFNL